MFERISLELEQKELFIKLVEASRNVPREERQKFYLSRPIGKSAEILHKGFPNEKIDAFEGDIEILGDNKLLRVSGYQGVPEFNVTPIGYDYYEFLRTSYSEPIEGIESDVRNFLNMDNFRKKYPKATQKWIDAESLLWKSETQPQYTTIGHLCREAVQEFADEIINVVKPPNIKPDKTKTVARMKSVFEDKEHQIGTTLKPFLDALIAFWGTTIDIIQRQEHGGNKEGEKLVWEDARRVVFQTAIVMYEIEKAIF
ncbi:MAG: hypothetical protein PF482_17025 [Desulfobacteraceae bacterium]|jgi:hypothetical protein|nr:hypothetical protein [Desulfobacteraceae bacterium]